MKEIIPFKTIEEAKKKLDNGGRFYHLFAKPGDGIITGGELSTAAGLVSSKAETYLFLHLSLSALQEQEQQEIISHFSPDLQAHYKRALPQLVEIDNFDQEVITGKTVIVSGYPKFMEDRTEFTAFIMIPIMTGKTMTFSMIPIFDQFDVYELYKNPEFNGDKTIIATVRDSKRLNPVYTSFAGIANELTFEAKAETPHRYYVDTLFYQINR